MHTFYVYFTLSYFVYFSFLGDGDTHRHGIDKRNNISSTAVVVTHCCGYDDTHRHGIDKRNNISSTAVVVTHCCGYDDTHSHGIDKRTQVFRHSLKMRHKQNKIEENKHKIKIKIERKINLLSA